MSFDRYRRDLEAVLRHRAGQRWARSRGVRPDGWSGQLAERRVDLVAPDGLAAASGATAGAEPGSEGAWLRAAIAKEAVDVRTTDQIRETGRVLDGLRWPDPRGTRWDEMEWRLATLDVHRDRDALAGPLSDASAVAGAAIDDLVPERRAARPADLAEPDPDEHARGRGMGALAGLAGDLLAATDEPFAAAVSAALGRAGLRTEGPAPAVDLPRFRTGAGLATRMPAADASLVRFVARQLELGADAEGRVRLEQTASAEPVPVAGVHVLEPGRDVRVVAGGPAPLAAYRSLLGGFGEGLSAGLAEERRRLGGWLGDPALGCLHRALFEHLAADAAWLERATRAPAERGWRLQAGVLEWLRLRELAATVVAVGATPAADLPVAVPGDAMARATGFTSPGDRTPWSRTPLDAADELAGRLAAAALGDLLASRWGTGWFASAAAGRLLRDLWAAPHGHLGALLRDLRLGPLAVDPLLERAPQALAT